MIQLESVELERVKVQHNQKMDQLEKCQETLLQVRPKSFPILVIPGFLPLLSNSKKKKKNSSVYAIKYYDSCTIYCLPDSTNYKHELDFVLSFELNC